MLCLLTAQQVQLFSYLSARTVDDASLNHYLVYSRDNTSAAYLGMYES